MLPEFSSLLVTGAALAAVLGLLWLAQTGLRRARPLLRPAGARLAIEEAMALDSRRRLVLIRCEGQRALLLTGGTQDVLIGWLPGDAQAGPRP